MVHDLAQDRLGQALSAGHPLDHGLSLHRPQPGERQGGDIRLTRPLGRDLELRPEGHDEHDRYVVLSTNPGAEHLQRTRIGPVGVLEELYGRMCPRAGQDELDQRSDGLLLDQLRIEFERRVATLARQGQQPRQERDERRRRLVPDQPDRSLEFVQSLVGRLGGDKAQARLQAPDHRIEGAVDRVRRAVVGQFLMVLVLDPLAEGGEQARLAHTRLGADQHDLRLARLGPEPAALQHLKLLLASDQRGLGRAEGLEPAHAFVDRQHPERLLRALEALELQGAEGGVDEQAAGERPRRGADHDTAFPRVSLQARGQIGRLARNRLFAGRALADQITDDDGTGGDADARLQRAGGAAHARHRPHQVQAGAHRPFGVVLVRGRIAEIGQHAVAHVLGHIAPEPTDRGGGALMVGRDQVAEVFGVQLCRQAGGVGEVAEQHRQHAPLSRGFRRRGRWTRLCGRSCGGRRRQGEAALHAEPGAGGAFPAAGAAERRQPRAARRAEPGAGRRLPIAIRAAHHSPTRR